MERACLPATEEGVGWSEVTSGGLPGGLQEGDLVASETSPRHALRLIAHIRVEVAEHQVLVAAIEEERGSDECKDVQS